MSLRLLHSLIAIMNISCFMCNLSSGSNDADKSQIDHLPQKDNLEGKETSAISIQARVFIQICILFSPFLYVLSSLRSLQL